MALGIWEKGKIRERRKTLLWLTGFTGLTGFETQGCLAEMRFSFIRLLTWPEIM